MHNQELNTISAMRKHSKPFTVSGWPLFLMFLIIVKGIFLWLDHHPMFFLMDSAAYIRSALWGWIPPGRSFVYGFFIRAVAVNTHSLLSLVVAQVFLGSITAIVLAHLLIRYFHVRRWLAFTVALLTSIEPLQLMYERYVMAETLALAVFVIYLWLILHYLENPRMRGLWHIQGIATLLISIRFAFIPMAWICSVVVPILAAPNIFTWNWTSDKKKIGQFLVHIALSLLLLFVFTTGYKQFFGFLKNEPAAYSSNSGFFSLCFILPIVEPDDFPDNNMGHKLLNKTSFNAKDRTKRVKNRWYEGGLIDRLCKWVPNKTEADAIARQVVINAITRRPLAFLKLGWDNLTDYFDPDRFQGGIEDDLGNRKLDIQFQSMLTKHFNYPEDRSSALALKSLTGRFFLHSGMWFKFLLFTPLWVILFIGWANEYRCKTLLIFLISLSSVGVAIFLVERPIVRFLHNSSWLFFLVAGVGMDRLFNFYRRNNLLAEEKID